MLAVTIKTASPQKIWLEVYDAKRPDVVFTKRYKTINGSATLFVRMPISPQKVIVKIYNDHGMGGFEVADIKKRELLKKIDAIDFPSAHVYEFIRFAEKFCYNLSQLPADKEYYSQYGHFTIRLYDELYNANGGKSNTPSRIGRRTGIIEVNKAMMLSYTFPMRMAILCHEFAHKFLNEDESNETEADLNGLLIYLGLGYPRIEAYEAFLTVFIGSPSEANKKRYEVIENFIDNFERNQLIIE